MITSKETMQVEVTQSDIWENRNIRVFGSPLRTAIRRDGSICNSAGMYKFDIDGVIWECDDETKSQEHAFHVGAKCKPYTARLIRQS